MAEIVYSSFSPAPEVTTADFDAMKRSFEAATINGKPDRFANGGPPAFPMGQGQAQGLQNQPPPLPAMLGSYADGYSGGHGAVNYQQAGPYGAYGAGGPVTAPFVPQAHQQPMMQGHQSQNSQTRISPQAFSNPTSPYLSPNPNALPFGSPSSQNGNLPLSGQPSYSGSAYDTLPSSPNPYANPYAGYGALGFANQGFGGMGIGMLGSPTLGGGAGQMQQGYGMPYPMIGQSGTAMIGVGQTGRTVYVGNLPSDASVDELLGLVRFGPIENVKILPEKSCAFISFLDPTTAAAFHSDALMRKLRLHEQDLKVGWGKPSAVPAMVATAVQQSGATRNVYLGNLDETVTESSLRDDLSRFGPIDQVKIVRDKNIGFVHFLSIATAIKVVTTLAAEPEWTGRRINYGKDRCAYVPKNQHQQQQHNLAAAQMGSMAAASFGGFFSPTFAGGFQTDANGMTDGSDPNAQPGNRTVYLGNIHPETTTEEICNTIRGGILQQIRYIPDKHICFVTFVESQCALAFYQAASFQGIALHNRRLKVGWGKHSGPPSPGISMVVQSGGSRNVYIGNIEDFDAYTEERLRKDFGEYGEIELINQLKEKQAAFVNFTNIANAIKAIEGMKSHSDYTGLKIAYGKDRCGNPPRSLGFNAQQNPAYAMRSPFPDSLGFPEGQLEAFDPLAAEEFEDQALEIAGGLTGPAADEGVVIET